MPRLPESRNSNNRNNRRLPLLQPPLRVRTLLPSRRHRSANCPSRGAKFGQTTTWSTMRTPADKYLVEKGEEEPRKKEAANAKAAAKGGGHSSRAIKSEKQPPLQTKLPASVEETEKMIIRNKERDISEETDYTRLNCTRAPAAPLRRKHKAEGDRKSEWPSGNIAER